MPRSELVGYVQRTENLALCGRGARMPGIPPPCFPCPSSHLLSPFLLPPPTRDGCHLVTGPFPPARRRRPVAGSFRVTPPPAVALRVTDRRKPRPYQPRDRGSRSGRRPARTSPSSRLIGPDQALPAVRAVTDGATAAVHQGPRPLRSARPRPAYQAYRLATVCATSAARGPRPPAPRRSTRRGLRANEAVPRSRARPASAHPARGLGGSHWPAATYLAVPVLPRTGRAAAPAGARLRLV